MPADPRVREGSHRETCDRFAVRREPLIGEADLERIETGAARLLDEVGIRVHDDGLRAFFAEKGFRTAGNRVRIEKDVFRGFLETERCATGNVALPMRPGPAKLTAYVSNYPQHVHDPETDAIMPFTSDRLVEMTKLADVLAGRGLISNPPGNPTDVPPTLQPIVQYWIAATYGRHGRFPVDPKASASFQYVREMSEVLGEPLDTLTVWVFSPLTLGGESLDMVLRFQDRLREVGVSSMPALGSTVPIHPGDAFAVALAEVAGSVVLLRERVPLPFRWAVGVCPVDMRSMAMVFGSPESFLMQLASEEVNAHLHGRPWHPGAGNIHSNAKLPGPQACAEKSSLMTAGALLGVRHFGAVGTLSLDEVFSPEQLLYDLDMKDHVERLVAGLDGGCDPDRCLADVRAGLAERGFAALETTLADHRSFYWQPALFDRDFLGSWRASGEKTIRTRARALISDLVGRHDFALDADTQRQLDTIKARAFERLA